MKENTEREAKLEVKEKGFFFKLLLFDDKHAENIKLFSKSDFAEKFQKCIQNSLN